MHNQFLNKKRQVSFAAEEIIKKKKLDRLENFGGLRKNDYCAWTSPQFT